MGAAVTARAGESGRGDPPVPGRRAGIPAPPTRPGPGLPRARVVQQGTAKVDLATIYRAVLQNSEYGTAGGDYGSVLRTVPARHKVRYWGISAKD